MSTTVYWDITSHYNILFQNHLYKKNKKVFLPALYPYIHCNNILVYTIYVTEPCSVDRMSTRPFTTTLPKKGKHKDYSTRTLLKLHKKTQPQIWRPSGKADSSNGNLHQGPLSTVRVKERTLLGNKTHHGP